MNNILSIGQRFNSVSHNASAVWLSFSLGIGFHHLWCALQKPGGLGKTSQALLPPKAPDYRGTQSKYLASTFGLTHLSYGDLMRKLRDDKASVVSTLPLKEGTKSLAVPDDLGALLLWREIELGMRNDRKMAWLVDGFPRNHRQVTKWMEQASSVQPVLYLFAPMSVSASRIDGRANSSGRPEDANRGIIVDRLHRYHKEREPLLAKLEDQGFQVKRIDSNRELAEVQQELHTLVKGITDEYVRTCLFKDVNQRIENIALQNSQHGVSSSRSN
ncbi:P-loop containing nucleoside triphosphate hydrolase protein [Apiospora arundinis]